MKASIKKSGPDAHVCCKLVLLYLDALEYLGTELTPAIIRAAYAAAHAADFDATMTRVRRLRDNAEGDQEKSSQGISTSSGAQVRQGAEDVDVIDNR